MQVIKATNQKLAVSIAENHTHNFLDIYAFILFPISCNLYSYSKFEVLIIFILNNMYDVVDFDSA